MKPGYVVGSLLKAHQSDQPQTVIARTIFCIQAIDRNSAAVMYKNLLNDPSSIKRMLDNTQPWPVDLLTFEEKKMFALKEMFEPK